MAILGRPWTKLRNNLSFQSSNPLESTNLYRTIVDIICTTPVVLVSGLMCQDQCRHTVAKWQSLHHAECWWHCPQLQQVCQLFDVVNALYVHAMVHLVDNTIHQIHLDHHLHHNQQGTVWHCSWGKDTEGIVVQMDLCQYVFPITTISSGFSEAVVGSPEE